MNSVFKSTMSNIQFSALEECQLFKHKLLQWANVHHDTLCYLESNSDSESIDNQCFIAIGVDQDLRVEQEGNAFEALQHFFEKEKNWLFGHLSYDLKNEVEPTLSSTNFDDIRFPVMYFFKPKILINTKGLSANILIQNADFQDFIKNLENIKLENDGKNIENKLEIHPRMSKAEYLQKVEAVRAYIAKGDIYEMNLCQEFFIEHAAINPLQLFETLNQVARTPFTAFYKIKNNYALCASPERFMQKRRQSLLVQPIKGTIKRGKTDEEDAQMRTELYNSPKDRSENVMIVDLMRNDLGRIAETGSVEVKELFGIYPYSNVFQMISTISATLRKDIHFAEALRACYPMGSMTGAPKIRAMQLIERYENTKRGLYSGSIGYISPEGDFDFNVVIRSILYNSDNQYLSFQVGGAIVYDSVPEQEYEECLLKASLIFKILGEMLIV
jgi:para-aminobenzoate synthetase component I